MRKELHKKLSEGVLSVNKRVYPLIMPQDTRANSIVYRVVGTVDTSSISCPMPLATLYMVQIDVFAHTYAQSVAIMGEVLNVLRLEFIAYNVITYEDYVDHTLKYRQVITAEVTAKYDNSRAIYNVVNNGVDVVNNGNIVVNMK